MHLFNPLDSRLLSVQPRRLHRISAWNEHIPFAMLLVELARPRKFVELGTQWGASYCAFCQAVEALDLPARGYAVDTWAGDEHAGFYGGKVYDDLKAHHHRYEKFSELLRMTFDEALAKIPDGTVDLLHIDGLHTYEAVKHDFETWLPKMSSRGVILFHDTAVKERGFGVHQLWSEITVGRTHFAFEHGYGLGVLAVGDDLPEALANFFQTANAAPEQTRALFTALGRRLLADTLLAHVEQENARLRTVENSRDYRWGRALVSPLRWLKQLLR